MDEARKKTLWGCAAILAVHVRGTLLKDLRKYPLCDFFLRQCVESMSQHQIADDLAQDPDFSLLAHFDKSTHMGRLEGLFATTIKTFGLSKEELKAQADFNFDVYDMTGFESVRAVFRLANALSQVGFTEFAFVRGKGLCDLKATKSDQPWFIEVKTLVLQTKSRESNVNGATEILAVDKFQPKTSSIADYVETISKQITGNLIGKARTQLMETAKQEGEAKKMVALVLNLFAADFFLDRDNLSAVYTRLRGELGEEWAKNYLADVDRLAFLTNQLYVF